MAARTYMEASLLPQALHISSPRIRKNIPLKLHTSRAPDGGIETVKTIIEGAAYDINWKLTTAVTLPQIRAMLEGGDHPRCAK